MLKKVKKIELLGCICAVIVTEQFERMNLRRQNIESVKKQSP